MLQPMQVQIRKKRLHFGLVFQNFNLFPQYTALQNVMLAGELLAKERPDYRANKKAMHAQLEQQARELLAQMGLSERADHYPHQLSGGQQQRVAIARALAQEPKLLVFDEPTGNLDVANEQRILRQARRLARTRGMTVLCTLHDLNQAMAYGDRLFLMRDGQVRYAGNGDILTPETVWDIFGARVRAAEIDGQKILIGVNEDEY